MKLLTNFTLDPLLAAWWPINWVVWGVQNLLGPHAAPSHIQLSWLSAGPNLIIPAA